MNAKEIRSKRMDLGGPFVDPIEAAKVELLQEIAAQLAELNEPVVVNEQAQPKWVWFNTGDKTRTAVDVQCIRTVIGYGRYVVLNNPFERQSITVYESLADVCAKLGIPTEAS